MSKVVDPGSQASDAHRAGGNEAQVGLHAEECSLGTDKAPQQANDLNGLRGVGGTGKHNMPRVKIVVGQPSRLVAKAAAVCALPNTAPRPRDSESNTLPAQPA